jgi:hypothetical protein
MLMKVLHLETLRVMAHLNPTCFRFPIWSATDDMSVNTPYSSGLHKKKWVKGIKI